MTSNTSQNFPSHAGQCKAGQTRREFLALAATAAMLPLGLAAISRGVGAQADAATSELHTAANTEAVVDAANAFLTMLSEPQRAKALVEMTAQNAARWSNFPAGVVPRNGIFFRDLSAEQSAAALRVARLALSEEGFARMAEIRAADDVYAKSSASRGPGGAQGAQGAQGARGPRGGAGTGRPGSPPPGGGLGGGQNLFGAGHYIIAFLGQPSKTAPWMLQLGGHHLAVNTFYKGASGSSTPYFVGMEPIRWADAAGRAHDPLAPMRDAMLGLLASLSPEHLRRARLGALFSDVSVGPGRDGQFPARREGVPVAELSEASKNWVRQAIAAWTGDSPQAAGYRRLYEAGLGQTFVAYSGTGGLQAVGDYVRIDGPRVWIEFACQPSRTEFPIHFHTVWRDRATDYGAHSFSQR